MPDQTGLTLLDVSPALEYGSPTPLSTHWIPLEEQLAHWMDVDTLCLPAPVAPLLSAIGYALFALARETHALQLYNLAGQQQEQVPAVVTRSRTRQTVRHVKAAAHHWSRAAFALDTVLPGDLEPQALARVHQLSRIARTQRERLLALTEEIQTEQAASTWLDGVNGERKCR